jgi:hypothetical protein
MRCTRQWGWGLGSSCGNKRGGQMQSTTAVTGTPTRGHALAHWASAEGTRSSTAEQGGRRERRWRRDADRTSHLLEDAYGNSTKALKALTHDTLSVPHQPHCTQPCPACTCAVPVPRCAVQCGGIQASVYECVVGCRCLRSGVPGS